jgi:hypothetical protein
VTNQTNKVLLDPRYLLIALLPASVFIFNALIIKTFVQLVDDLPLRIAEFNGNSEGAARIVVLSAFMLFMGTALAALILFGATLRMFDWRGRVVPFLAFVTMAGAAIATMVITQVHRTHDYTGHSLACLAAGYDKAQSDRARADEQAALQASRPPRNQSAGVEVSRLRCRDVSFAKMEWLGVWQFRGVVLSFAALVIGAICCLAACPVTTAGDAELQHWETQSGRLNTYLYLGALLLGTALVFINAYLRWPAYALLEPAKYNELGAALVSYYGVVFTIMLASFYVPAAAILAGKVKALKPAAQGESKLPEAFKGPLQLLKIVVGLFSTAVAGALPSIIDLIR